MEVTEYEKLPLIDTFRNGKIKFELHGSGDFLAIITYVNERLVTADSTLTHTKERLLNVFENWKKRTIEKQWGKNGNN